MMQGPASARPPFARAAMLLMPSPVNLKGVIFDIDGTLIDSNDIHCDAWLEAFEHFGKTIERDVMRHQIGKGGDLLVPDLLNGREMQRFGKKLQDYRGEIFRKKYMQRVKPFPGMKRWLGQLVDAGVKLAVASSAKPDEVEYYTGLLDIDDLLSGSTSTGDATISKPSPEIFQAALERIDTDPRRTLVVGDTPYDILAGHRAALPVAAVLSGGFERELLTKAEFLFADVEEMMEKIQVVEDYFNE